MEVHRVGPRGVVIGTSVSVLGAIIHGLLDGTVGFDGRGSRMLIGVRRMSNVTIIDIRSCNYNVDRRKRGGLLRASARFDAFNAGGRRNSKLNLLLYGSFIIGGNNGL